MLISKAPMTFQHFMIGLFAVANNFPALGPFLQICNGLNRQEQLKLCYIASLTSFIVMVVALVVGGDMLQFFGISIPAFRIAGGLILCLSGLNMINSKPDLGSDKVIHSNYSKVISQAVIPIAIPLTTGAGTFSTIIIFSDEVGNNWTDLGILFLAIVFSTVFIYLIFKYSMKLLDVLGHIGMNVLIKVVGLFTLSLGIQFIIMGAKAAFPALNI